VIQAFGSARYLQVFGIFGLSSWCWILAFFGYGFKHLTRSTPWLAYANAAVLPFYVMHQTVLLTVGYFVTRWRSPARARVRTDWPISAISAIFRQSGVCRSRSICKRSTSG
jgi:apolipoprotein N-acyltransferase